MRIRPPSDWTGYVLLETGETRNGLLNRHHMYVTGVAPVDDIGTRVDPNWHGGGHYWSIACLGCPHKDRVDVLSTTALRDAWTGSGQRWAVMTEAGMVALDIDGRPCDGP